MSEVPEEFVVVPLNSRRGMLCNFAYLVQELAQGAAFFDGSDEFLADFEIAALSDSFDRFIRSLLNLLPCQYGL